MAKGEALARQHGVGRARTMRWCMTDPVQPQTQKAIWSEPHSTRSMRRTTLANPSAPTPPSPLLLLLEGEEKKDELRVSGYDQPTMPLRATSPRAASTRTGLFT